MNLEREVHKAFLVLIKKCWEESEDYNGKNDEKNLKKIKRKNVDISEISMSDVVIKERKCC